jgi:hypothetical protein
MLSVVQVNVVLLSVVEALYTKILCLAFSKTSYDRLKMKSEHRYF